MSGSNLLPCSHCLLQAQRPRLTRSLDRIGEVWSKAVIVASLATAVLLPWLGVPFLGDRGALYRAMGVLTAGSPCALALVPLAYVCAIGVITMKGMLVKSGAAIDALHLCRTVALDKTGTITSGSLSLAEGFMLDLPAVAQPAAGADAWSTGSDSSSQTGEGVDAEVVINDQLLTHHGATIPAHDVIKGKTSDGIGVNRFKQYPSSGHEASSGTTASVAGGRGDNYEVESVKYAVALSRLSNHPVSRAMVVAAPDVDADVTVASFQQVIADEFSYEFTEQW